MVIRFSLTVEKILAFFMSLGSREFCEIDRLLMAVFAGQGHPVRWSNPMQMGGQVHAITHSAKLIELTHQILGT